MQVTVKLTASCFNVPTHISAKTNTTPVIELPLSTLDVDTLERMCTNFRHSIFTIAGYTPTTKLSVVPTHKEMEEFLTNVSLKCKDTKKVVGSIDDVFCNKNKRQYTKDTIVKIRKAYEKKNTITGKKREARKTSSLNNITKRKGA